MHPEIRRHYMRIRPPERGEAYACESCGTEMIRLNNRPPGTRTEFAAREIVDAGFLELVRYKQHLLSKIVMIVPQSGNGLRPIID